MGGRGQEGRGEEVGRGGGRQIADYPGTVKFKNAGKTAHLQVDGIQPAIIKQQVALHNYGIQLGGADVEQYSGACIHTHEAHVRYRHVLACPCKVNINRQICLMEWQ